MVVIMRNRFVLGFISAFLAFALHLNAEPDPPKFFGTIWKSWTSSSAEPAYIGQGKLFNQVTPENAGKWGSAEPTEGNFRWSVLDAMFNRAESEPLMTKQHCFVWGQQQPDWVNDSNAKTAVTNWMHAFMQRYGEKVDFIDVVNEPLHAKPSYRNGLGGDGATGWDWMIWVFEQARVHAPNAKLLLNDYNILNNDGATTTYKGLIELLQSRGLIDGIGLQAHFLEGTSAAQIKRNLDTLAQTGLPIYISEYDLNIANDQSQLSVYQSQFPVFWEHPAVKGVTLWGFRQGTMWRTDAYLVRTDGTERPALTWLREYFLANKAPYVHAGGDQMSQLPVATVSLDGTVSDDGLPEGATVSTTWSKVSGPGTVTFGNAAAVDTTATFGAAGVYVLRLTASDTELSASDDVQITVLEALINGEVVAAINCGGGAFTAADGTSYAADQYFSGGSTYSTVDAIAGTEDDTLYQSERYGAFTYSVPVPNGTYDVLLQFAEIYETANGARVFDVSLEGAVAVNDLDIHAVAGHDAAHDVLVSGMAVSDGALTITTSVVADNPKLSAFTIVAAVPVTVNHSVPYSWLESQNSDWTNDFEAAVLEDPDGDGFTTWQEYWSGTDPQSSNSFLTIDAIQFDGSNIVLQWQHAEVGAGINPIAIQSTMDLVTGTWVNVGSKSPANGTNTWSGVVPQAQFYRLQAVAGP